MHAVVFAGARPRLEVVVDVGGSLSAMMQGFVFGIVVVERKRRTEVGRGCWVSEEEEEDSDEVKETERWDGERKGERGRMVHSLA